MVAYVVLLLAVLSRLLPHALHISAWGVTALGGGLLFFGSRLGKTSRWQAVFVVLAIAVTDWYLTSVVYGFPFHVRGYVVTWAWYAALCCFGSLLLHRRKSLLRVVGAAAGSSTGFFLLSNGMVWLSGTMYPKNAGGLLACYVAGVPFYRNDVLSTLAVCGVLFGLPVVARRMSEGLSGVNRGAAV